MASTAGFTTISVLLELLSWPAYMCRKGSNLSFLTLQIQHFSFLVFIPYLLLNPAWNKKHFFKMPDLIFPCWESDWSPVAACWQIIFSCIRTVESSIQGHLFSLLRFLTRRETPEVHCVLKLPRQVVTKQGTAAEQMKNQGGIFLSFFINVLSARSIWKIHLRFVAIKIKGGTWKAFKCHRWQSYYLSWMGPWVTSPLNHQCSALPNKEAPGTPGFCPNECGNVNQSASFQQDSRSFQNVKISTPPPTTEFKSPSSIPGATWPTCFTSH